MLRSAHLAKEAHDKLSAIPSAAADVADSVTAANALVLQASVSSPSDLAKNGDAIISALAAARDRALVMERVLSEASAKVVTYLNAEKLNLARSSTGKVQVGQRVVARIPAAKQQAAMWILGVVTAADITRDVFSVKDDDPGDQWEPNPHKQTYNLPSRSLVPLPTAETFIELPKHAAVLALWPRSSTFYSAKVLQPPSKFKSNDVYEVIFEDDQEEKDVVSRKVNKYFVVIDPAG